MLYFKIVTMNKKKVVKRLPSSYEIVLKFTPTEKWTQEDMNALREMIDDKEMDKEFVEEMEGAVTKVSTSIREINSPQLCKIIKLKESDDPVHPLNIEVGYERIGYFSKDPVKGAPFWLEAGPGFPRFFRTSPVVEVMSENTFKTLNSIYKWELLEMLPEKGEDINPIKSVEQQNLEKGL